MHDGTLLLTKGCVVEVVAQYGNPGLRHQRGRGVASEGLTPIFECDKGIPGPHFMTAASIIHGLIISQEIQSNSNV